MKRWLIETVQVGDTRCRLELARCGNARCERCREAPAHGPYWYAHQPKPGAPTKTVRRYLGKTLPPEVEAARRARGPQLAERYRDRPLEHEELREVLSKLEGLGEVLMTLEVHGWDRELEAERLTPADRDELERMAAMLQEAGEELGQATTRLRRRPQRVRDRLRQASEELDDEEDLEDDEEDLSSHETSIRYEHRDPHPRGLLLPRGGAKCS
jgi:hypothetical protein